MPKNGKTAGTYTDNTCSTIQCRQCDKSEIKTRNVNKSHFSTHILINDAKCHTEEMICMKWEFSSVGITTIQSTILYVLHYGS